MDIDAKSVAIGGGAVFLATQLFGGTSKKSSGTNGLGKPSAKRKSGTGTKRKSSTKKAGAGKAKSKK